MEGSIILVKHAMPEVDASKPASEWKLSERGLKQAKKFANFVRDNLDVDPIIYSSEQDKAKETASILAETLGLTLKTNPKLGDLDRPALPLTNDEGHQGRIETVFENKDQAILGSESAVAALARFEEGLKEILKEPLEDERIVVSHGTVISLFLEKYNESINGFDTWKKMGCPSYVVVNLEDNSILELNGKPLSN